MPSHCPLPPVAGDATSLDVGCQSTRWLFVFYGFLLSSWAPLVPFLKERMELSDSALGLFFPCMSIGSLAMLPVASAWVARMGCRRVLTTASLILMLMFIPLALVSSPWLFPLVLLLFGASSSLFAMALNVQSVTLQHAMRRPLISGFHGRFSLGSIAGALFSTLLYGTGLPPLAVIGAVLLLLSPLLWYWLPRTVEGAPSGVRRRGFVMPRGLVLVLGFLCFFEFMCEGSIGDWSAVFLTQERALQPAYAGWGYTAFVVSMALGRLSGDRLTQRIGGRRLLMAGALLAAAGYLLTIIFPWTAISLLGFACIGLGVSNAAPVIFSYTARQDVMSINQALATINIFGAVGTLVGPLIIGTTAQAWSLGVAFLLLALAQVAISMIARVKLT